MEPFGLFQFLQSLLQNSPNKPESTEETQENTPLEKDVKPTPEPMPTPNNEAYLQFITNHERRAQNVRKK